MACIYFYWMAVHYLENKVLVSIHGKKKLNPKELLSSK